MVDLVKNGGPAFPYTPDSAWATTHTGMTLRDYFAGQALAAGLIDDGVDLDTVTPKEMAEFAYKIADAMLEARNSRKG